MEICELNILSVYLKKWSYGDNRINLSFSFFTDVGYGRSAVDMRINNPQIMVNEFLNNVVYRTKEYFSNIEHEYANASIKIMSDSSVKGKMQGFFMKMVKEYNFNKKSHGKSRMISSRSMDFFYNDFEYESLDDASKFYVHLNRGVNKINGDLWKTAMEELQTSLGFNPENAVANKYMAFALMKMGRLEDSIPFYEKYAKLDNSLVSLNDLAKAYTMVKKYDKAKKTFKEMKKANPDDLLAKIGEAQIAYMQGKPYFKMLDKIFENNDEWLRNYLQEMWEFKLPEFAEDEENKWNAATASRFLGYDRPFDLTKRAFNNEIPCYFDQEKGTIRFVQTELENWVELSNRYNINGQHHEIYRDRLTEKELSIGIRKPSPKPKTAKKAPAKRKPKLPHKDKFAFAKIFMQKKLLLINPWIFDFTAFDLWSKPLGLLYIASFLRKFKFNISYIDCMDKYDFGWQPKVKHYGQGNFYRKEVEKPKILDHIPRKYCRYGIPEKTFKERLSKLPKPDAILITSIMTYWYLGPKRVVELVRDVYPEVPVILGGVYATLLPKHAKQVVKPDYVITGPGEIKVLELLNEILDVDINKDEIPSSIEKFPYPAFDLINHPDYMIIMTARGCPYDCSFCAQKKISMPFAQRSPNDVLQELVYHYQKYRIRDFAFYDDALFINKKKHIEIILEKVVESRLPIRFHSPNGLFAKYIDERLAQLMFQTNFKTIRLSFETSNEKRRKDMYSKISNDDMINAVENLEKAGYERSKIEAYALMGLPEQDLTEIVATMIFLNNLGVQIKLASFSPIPGTLDFDRAVETGIISPDIDPLLTNKTIFPLSDDKINYDTYKKIRTFSQVLNFAAQKNLKPFYDAHISAAINAVLKEN